MSDGSSLSRRRSRTAATLLAIAMLATPALLVAPGAAASKTTEQRCHDFNRFGERWELCRYANGVVERHRLGILP
jgi:hypothetical protein